MGCDLAQVEHRLHLPHALRERAAELCALQPPAHRADTQHGSHSAPLRAVCQTMLSAWPPYAWLHTAPCLLPHAPEPSSEIDRRLLRSMHT